MSVVAEPHVFVPEMVSPHRARPKREPFYPESDGEPMGETDQHRDVNNYLVEALKIHYADRQNDVYVSGDNFIYFVKDNPRRFVSPDVYVVFGVPMKQRKSFKTWEEGNHLPSVVMEVTSRSTQDDDLLRKFELYQDVLLVPEYFMFDPTGEYLDPQLAGFRMNDGGEYIPIALLNNRLHSEQLGLDFVLTPHGLRVFDPATGEFYPTLSEQRIAIYQERLRAESETQRAEAEARRADAAEEENARLRAQLAAAVQTPPNDKLPPN